MKKKELDHVMRVASDAYEGEDEVWNYYKHPEKDWGDGLARFITQEIRECADGEDSLGSVAAALTKAVDELTRVRDAVANIA